MADTQMTGKRALPPNKDKLTIAELKQVHDYYTRFKSEWDFLYAAYEGTRELVNMGYLVKHERETEENYKNRKKQAYGFNYTQSIVDTLNFYLHKKPPKRNIPDKIGKDALYTMFMEDCNLEGDTMDLFLAEQSRLASIMGHCGILVDKAAAELDSRQDQIDEEVYAYVSCYYPQAILDWAFERNAYGRPTLTYLKLKQDNGQYALWFEDHFEIWEVPLDEEGKEKTPEEQAVLVESIAHNIEEIPFIFIINKKWKVLPIGKSDIADVARIDVSIIRNLSQGEEIVDYSAFPMMRKPFKESRPDAQTDPNDDVGPTAVLGFDPDNPDSKPDWLESEAEGPLTAIISWINSKVVEVYRSSNIGGMAATEVQTQARSGVAMQTEFQMLNSALVRKAITLELVERRIYYFWYKWEFEDEAKALLKDTNIERDRTYDVEDLAQDLDNILTAKTIVTSKKFNEAMQKKAVRKMLPSWNDSKLKDIDSEIEDSIEEEENAKEEINKLPSYDPFGNKGQQSPGSEEEEDDNKTIPFQPRNK